ncbi:hypothetical protein B0H14DRAFT_107910 [Mycena olivaceomarginata]|nr:hypothetical protein B0H14DRAFT_107910 [Mycena olivaceomarginata]
MPSTPSPPTSNRVNLKKATQLLGLPKSDPGQATGRSAASASRMSLQGIKELGWEVFTLEERVNDYWLKGPREDSVFTFVETNAGRRFNLSGNATPILDHLLDVRTKYMTVNESRQPLDVSKRYQLPKACLDLTDDLENINTLEASFLKICLHFVDQASKKLEPEEHGKDLKWVNRPSSITPYPVPNLYFEMEATDDGSFAKERAVVSLLRLTALRQEESARYIEMRRDFVCSSFSVWKNRVLTLPPNSGLKLDFPDFLRPTKAFAYPDVATLRQGGRSQFPYPPWSLSGKARSENVAFEKPMTPLINSPNLRTYELR